MICGNVQIRYIYIIDHDEVAEEYRVGCVFSENMTKDYVNPILLER